jgi:imidazoleglycerol phosphate synthase cyclase subunit
MLAKRVIACLDVRDGVVVKGRRFVELREVGDPVKLAQRYDDDGVDEIVVLDISATLEGRVASLKAVEAIACAIDVPLTVGGGVRCIEDIRRVLDAGADKVAVNSAAYTDPELIARAAERFGKQCVVSSIDARRTNGRYEVIARSATAPAGLEAIAWAQTCDRMGAGEILLTSIDRDGMQQGFDAELISAVASSVGIPVVASGGAATPDSIADAFAAGADAALAASILHDGRYTIGQIKARCIERGVLVRT